MVSNSDSNLNSERQFSLGPNKPKYIITAANFNMTSTLSTLVSLGVGYKCMLSFRLIGCMNILSSFMILRKIEFTAIIIQ